MILERWRHVLQINKMNPARPQLGVFLTAESRFELLLIALLCIALLIYCFIYVAYFLLIPPVLDEAPGS